MYVLEHKIGKIFFKLYKKCCHYYLKLLSDMIPYAKQNVFTELIYHAHIANFYADL